MVDTNLTWAQGEDLYLRYIYSTGPDEFSLTPVNLTTGYAVRMDIVQSNGARLYTFNSADIPDVDLEVSQNQPDNVKEATLSSGAGGTPNIVIKVPRSLTLPAGALYTQINNGNLVFQFDVFLRNTTSDEQVRIDRGTITIDRSYTLWL
jgi:hypothetical protein